MERLFAGSTNIICSNGMSNLGTGHKGSNNFLVSYFSNNDRRVGALGLDCCINPQVIGPELGLHRI